MWFAAYNWASSSNQFLGLAVENGFVLCWILLVFYSLDEAATTSMGKKTVGRGVNPVYYMFCAFKTK